jgi:hypothetical protein
MEHAFASEAHDFQDCKEVLTTNTVVEKLWWSEAEARYLSQSDAEWWRLKDPLFEV